MNNILIGCDPEVFLHDGIEYISAYGLFPGTKHEPHPVEKGAVQVDGMALEFNIVPASTAEEFNDNIETVLGQMEEMVSKVNPDLQIVFEPFAEFDPTYFQLLPYECKLLGCEPDYNPIGQQKVPDPALSVRPFRTAAGHVHIGWTKDEKPFDEKHFDTCKKIARAFQAERGFVPLTKSERERIKYYGQPGSFRPKTYGVELRSPSNLWVKTKEGRMEMFNTVKKRMERISV